MPTHSPTGADPSPAAHASRSLPTRHFLGNHFVYCVISQRAGGLSIGINMNPDKRCNFDCIYCEIDRSSRGGSSRVKVSVMIEELEKMLTLVHEQRLGELGFEGVPHERLPFKEVALSGEGEPTLCPNFRQVVEAIVHLRARRLFPLFKIVLITNAIGLNIPETRAGIDLLSSKDEVWAKLDAGTQAYMDVVNRPGVPIDLVLDGITALGRRRPIIIQSLFPLVDGIEPPDCEIQAYAENLLELKLAGAQITSVQVYSAHRAAMDAACGHLSLRTLSKIARTVREVSGLKAEVF